MRPNDPCRRESELRWEWAWGRVSSSSAPPGQWEVRKPVARPLLRERGRLAPQDERIELVGALEPIGMRGDRVIAAGPGRISAQSEREEYEQQNRCRSPPRQALRA